MSVGLEFNSIAHMQTVHQLPIKKSQKNGKCIATREIKLDTVTLTASYNLAAGTNIDN